MESDTKLSHLNICYPSHTMESDTTMYMLSAPGFSHEYYSLRADPGILKGVCVCGGGGGRVQQNFLQKKGRGGQHTFSGQFVLNKSSQKEGGSGPPPSGSALSLTRYKATIEDVLLWGAYPSHTMGYHGLPSRCSPHGSQTSQGSMAVQPFKGAKSHTP